MLKIVSNTLTSGVSSKLKKTKKDISMHYLSRKEKNSLKQDISLSGLYVFEYLMGKAFQPNIKITDDIIANDLELASTSIRNIRLNLIKSNYYYVLVTVNKGSKHYQYFLGKEAVYKHKYFNGLFGIDNPLWIAKKFTKEKVEKILLTNNATPMEKIDILNILTPCWHKIEKSKKEVEP